MRASQWRMELTTVIACTNTAMRSAWASWSFVVCLCSPQRAPPCRLARVSTRCAARSGLPRFPSLDARPFRSLHGPRATVSCSLALPTPALRATRPTSNPVHSLFPWRCVPAPLGHRVTSVRLLTHTTGTRTQSSWLSTMFERAQGVLFAAGSFQFARWCEPKGPGTCA